MDYLMQMYWKPVYFHIRRKGHDVEDAKDLTQQFFTVFMERDALRNVDKDKGKFRTFILACLEHFLCDEYDRRKAKKRQPIPDVSAAEAQFDRKNTFEVDWATALLERAFLRLKEQAPREAGVVEAQMAGKESIRDLADQLGATEANVKVMAHRGRSKLRAIILEELRQTVSRPGQEQEELTDLFKAFSL